MSFDDRIRRYSPYVLSIVRTVVGLLLTDRFYNPQDEGRIPYDDASINYDWETQRK